MGIFHRARTFPLKWDLSSVGRFRPGGSYFRKICCLYPPFFDYLFLLRTIFVCILPAFVQPSFAVPLCRIRSLLPNRCLFLLSHVFPLRKRWMRQGVLTKPNKDCDGDYCHTRSKVMRIHEVLFHEHLLTNFINFLTGSCRENHQFGKDNRNHQETS